MENIQEIVQRLYGRHRTRDPFRLADELGILVLYEPLGTIMGYYNRCYRQRLIHINQALDDRTAAFTCAHELGHAVLHTDINTPFLRRCTHYCVGALETAANRFAVSLLYSDDDLQPFVFRTIQDAADFMGVDVALAKYRMSSVEPEINDDWT